jgi:rubrerythrin
MSSSVIVMEIKKERLKRHLDELEELIGEWRRQLFAPDLFHVSESNLWSVSYRPTCEQDLDNTHMLRRHIRSRAFWKHHGEWENKLGAIDQKSQILLEVANAYMAALAKEKMQTRFTPLFIRVALEHGFTWCTGREPARQYGREPSGRVWCGAHFITEETSPEELVEVEKAHRCLSSKLRGSDEMKEVVHLWEEAKKSEKRMGKLLSDVLKSGDIIYPCRFCRKLFQG